MAQLNEQQKYLLGRIPGSYDLKELEQKEPSEVRAAKKVIDAWKERSSAERCAYTNKYKKAVSAAREAVYFKKPEEALAVIKALEAEFPAKCKC